MITGGVAVSWQQPDSAGFRKSLDYQALMNRGTRNKGDQKKSAEPENDQKFPSRVVVLFTSVQAARARRGAAQLPK